MAAYTRLSGLQLMEFKADEAQIAGLAVDIAHGQWPAASIATSNGGLDNPPLPVYLFAFPALFTSSPTWQLAVVGVLEVAAIALTFAIGSRWFGARAGLGAAALYAAAAYPVIFSQKLAGPFLQPVFATLLLCALLAVLSQPASAKPSAWPWAGATLLLGILIQLHLGALLLAPLVALLLAADILRKGSWRPLGAAALGGLVVMGAFAPYLVFEARHRGSFLNTVGSYVRGTPGWTAEAFRDVWITMSSPGYGDVTGAAAGLFNAESWPAGYLALLVGIAVLGGFLVALARSRQPRYLTLSAFVLVPLLLTLHHGPGLEIHYFAFLLPALFLLGGIGFDAFLRAAPRLRAPGFALLGLLLAVQVLNFRHFTAFLTQHALPDSYGLPLAYQQRLFDHVTGGGRILIAAANRDEAATAAYFLRDVSHTEVSAADGLLLPSGGGAYVTFSRGTPAAHALQAGLRAAYVEPLPGGDEAAVYQLPPNALQAIGTGLGLRSEPRAEWSDGLRLLGVAAPRGLPAQLAAAWQVTAAVDASTLFFSQLLDDGGKQWFDRDAVPVESGAWQPGDTLLTITPAALPAGAPRQEYWWTVGLYVEGGRRVPLTGGDSQLQAARLKGGQPPPTPSGLAPADGTFGGAIQLRGYALEPGTVILQWACLASVDRDYTVFVHVLDSAGSVAAQADSQPDHEPTSLWDPGELIPDRHAVPIPPGAQIEVGLYDLATRQRLTLADGSDHLTLRAT
ncbi:MAG TPA: hypothetical protein VF157_12265 [Chloroflexota bacterium]